MAAIFPASVTGTGVYLAFPDVCKHPVLGIPTPIPYPNIAKTAQAAQTAKKTKPARKATTMTKTGTSRTQGDEPGTMKGIVSPNLNGEISQLKGLLGQLNSKLQAMQSNDPNQWQKVLQDYAVAAGALYVTIYNNKN